jgi:hypothetical protein
MHIFKEYLKRLQWLQPLWLWNAWLQRTGYELSSMSPLGRG